MRHSHPVLLLLLVAALTMSACTSTEQLQFNTPQRIAEDPTLQFDFTVPILDDAYYRRIRVNVSFEGHATFYMRDDEFPYKRIKAAVLTDEEAAYLVDLFEEAGFAQYPVAVPQNGRLATPAHVVQLGYRAERGSAPHTVSGAVSKQRNVAAYPDGFFDLIDGLADFIEDSGRFRVQPKPADAPITAAGSE